MRKLINRSISMPAPLWAYLDEQAELHGMALSPFVRFLCQIHRQTTGLAEVRAQVSNHEARLRAAGL